MSGLPSMINGGGYKKDMQVKFSGYDHNLGASEGSLWDMKNLCGDYYPLLSPRPKRKLIRTLKKPNGIFAKDGIFWVDGTEFFFDGKKKGTVSDSKKTFCALGPYIVVFPDKVYYHTVDDKFGSLEAEWKGTVTFKDGTYAGESAKANTISTSGAAFPFDVNEAIVITGSSKEQNNKTAIIREISDDKKTLRFYENTFAEGSVTESVTLKREVPDLDFLCENENRIWGGKGDTIRCSYLGNPFIWDNYDTVSTACFAVDVGSAGDFTGCASFLGYPVFFKEEKIYKVYGSKPSNFQVMSSASLGIESGSGMSAAIAGEVLFYLSRVGIVAYSGGIPSSVYQPFGNIDYQDAVAGSDGRRYFVSMKSQTSEFSLFVYDTESGMWHKEDEIHVIGFAWDKGLYFLDSSGNMWLDGRSRDIDEGLKESTISSMVEFNDFVDGSPDKKGFLRFQIRGELNEGASIQVFVKFDSDEWESISTIKTSKKRTFLLPIVPRRCDHFRMKLEGIGDWKLWSITKERYFGSEL